MFLGLNCFFPTRKTKPYKPKTHQGKAGGFGDVDIRIDIRCPYSELQKGNYSGSCEKYVSVVLALIVPLKNPAVPVEEKIPGEFRLPSTPVKETVEVFELEI